VITSAWVADITQTTWSLYLLLIPGYTVAAYESLPRALAGLALAQLGPWAVDAFAKHVNAGDFAFTSIVVGIAWVTGRAMHSRRLLHVELLEKAERLTAEREDRTRLAVADERTRIARELHAMVASHVSAMVIQAEAAKRMLDQSPAAADEAMLAIEETGREALSEMRRILGVLRRSGEDPAVLAPQPGVGQLHALVESARTNGGSIELHVHGEPGPLPFAVDLAVYRILEEVRWELDLRGFNHVKILASGGIDEYEILRLNPLVDGYGVGTSIANAPVLSFALDIMEIEGEPMAKRGKLPRLPGMPG